MATLRDISLRIKGVKNTSKITQAMRMVSAAKLKRAQSAIESARPYVLKLAEVMQNLIASVGEDYSNPLVQKRSAVNNIALIVIASDRGLCGGFNNNLFKVVTNYIDKELPNEYPDANVKLITVGKKTVQFFNKRDYEVIKRYPGIFQDLNFTTAQEIVNIVSNAYMKGEIDKVVIHFNWFKNVITQVPNKVTLLPIEPDSQDEDSADTSVDYIFEPERTEILDNLLPKHLDIQLWRTLLESYAAEEAARMMAMENATNNANDLVKELEMIFNRERQAAITKEMLDIVGGANALKKA